MQKTIKKILGMMVIMMIAIMFMSLTVAAVTEQYESNGYKCYLNDGCLTIYSAESDENGEVFIPAEIDGYPVVNVKTYSSPSTVGAVTFSVDSENEYLSNDEIGVLFNKDKTELLVFPANLSISEYRIPSTVVKIGERAFESNGSSGYIGRLIFSEHLTEINNTPNNHSFCYSNKIVSFEVDANNPSFASKDGVLYNKDFSELISIPAGTEYDEFVVPNTVKNLSYHGSTSTKIGVLRFESESQIEKFDGGAFSFSSIKKLILPPCLKFENINFGDAAIDEIVFEERSKEEIIDNSLFSFVQPSIELPLSVVEIKDNVFENYKNVTVLNPYCKLADEFYTGTYGRPHITGYVKSTAYDYAQKNSFDFMALECDHRFGFSSWTPDYNSGVATRECNTCYFIETTELKTENKDDVEIVAPEHPDCDFEVEQPKENSTTYILAQRTVSENTGDKENVLKVFDITLKNKDGIHVQPDGSVKVKLPFDWEKNGIYKVYRVNDDGTLTDMKAYRQGSHMVFETNHFSIYVIVAEKQSVGEPTDNPDEKPNDKPNDNAKNCACNCHKKGISNFFWKIANFFNKLFKIKSKQFCGCGIAHY